MTRSHAVVMGGSIGGMMAARVLTDHFTRVTLLERDEFPALGEHRRGVPQGRHAHALLASGSNRFDELFPGFTRELIEHGGAAGDPGRTGAWYQEGGYMARVDSGIRAVLASRPLVEGLLRRRLLTLKNLEARPGCTVKEWLHENGRVSGVRCENGEAIPADLVVDATGRGSKSPAWLEALGYSKPQTEKVEVAIGYSTRIFRRRPEHLNGDNFSVVTPTRANPRSGVILAMEDDRWICTLVGYFGNYAPLELEGYRAFARGFPGPEIHSVVSTAEPLCEGIEARFPASVRQRYENLERFPAGLLVYGDTICSFNPIYGQGMSVSALESVALDNALRAGDSGLSQRFFSAAARVVDSPWAIAAGNDLKIPQTIGARTPAVRFVNWYMERLLKASHRDPVLSRAFHRVGNLLAPPPSLLSPAIAWRVLTGGQG